MAAHAQPAVARESVQGELVAGRGKRLRQHRHRLPRDLDHPVLADPCRGGARHVQRDRNRQIPLPVLTPAIQTRAVHAVASPIGDGFDERVEIHLVAVLETARPSADLAQDLELAPHALGQGGHVRVRVRAWARTAGRRRHLFGDTAPLRSVCTRATVPFPVQVLFPGRSTGWRLPLAAGLEAGTRKGPARASRPATPAPFQPAQAQTGGLGARASPQEHGKKGDREPPPVPGRRRANASARLVDGRREPRVSRRRG